MPEMFKRAQARHERLKALADEQRDLVAQLDDTGTTAHAAHARQLLGILEAAVDESWRALERERQRLAG